MNTPADQPAPPTHTPTPLQRRIPNLLTFARLIIAVLFFATLSLFDVQTRGSWVLPFAAGLFIVAAITDALDGYLARRWNAVSVLGRILDPFADKVLVLGAFVIMLMPGFTSDYGNTAGFAPWMVVVIISRELLVTTIRSVFESRGVDFSAAFAGKLKMILQSVAVPLILLIAFVAWRSTPIGSVSLSLEGAVRASSGVAWVVTIVTLWSAVPYVSRAIKMRSKLGD